MQEVTKEELSASMRFEWPIPPKGTRIRVTAWVLVQSSHPDAAIGLSANWLTAEHRWYTKEDLGGGVTVPVTHNEWQKLAVEIIVPDIDDLKYISPSIGGAHTAASKVWIGEVKLETVVP
jgi:hypothetical protein